MSSQRESDLVRVIRAEWRKRVQAFVEGVVVKFDNLSAETKLIHKKSGIRYTVSKLNDNEAILRAPEGAKFLVDRAALENEYEVA